MELTSYLITPEEFLEGLQQAENQPLSIIPVCASWFLPNDPEKRTGEQVFQEAHISNAHFLDIDLVKGDSPYPHMLPSPEVFAQAMSKLGIKPDDELVVYDTQELDIFSAPRVGWMFRVFGHKKVHVLNNFKLWVDQGYPTETGAEMIGIAKSRCAKAQVLDARPTGRWTGELPEPRPGLPSGHMPGSTSVPFSELLDPKTKTLLHRDELQEKFKALGVEASKPAICTCGTGVTAAVIDAALNEAYGESEKRRLYDGSWTEWAQRASEDDGLIEQSSQASASN